MVREIRQYPLHRWIALAAGPLVALAMVSAPPPVLLSVEGWWTAAVAVWMAIWWMTEAIPLATTALLPLALFPLLGLDSLKNTVGAYAHPLVLLFLGGFLMARALNAWELDRRLAYLVISTVGSSPVKVVAGVMLATAFLSMWVSNTATAMMMLPIGISITRTFDDCGQTSAPDFSRALLLGIAYAATIGGIGTLIGTPPNALFAAFMADNHGVEVGFLRWMLIGVPIVVVLLPIAWLVLTRFAFRIGSDRRESLEKIFSDGWHELPPLSTPARTVSVVITMTAFCWVFRPAISKLFPGIQLSDAGIAIIGAVLLFAIPADIRKGKFLLSWQQAREIRWDVLILFGGGLALASAMAQTDLAQWLGSHFSRLEAMPLVVGLVLMGLVVVLSGELASNTAIAAVLLPVAGATASGMGIPATVLALPVALFATLGFMLPVATPPNAVIFGSGSVDMRDMMRAGVILDLVGIMAVSLMVVTLGQWLFVP